MSYISCSELQKQMVEGMSSLSLDQKSHLKSCLTCQQSLFIDYETLEVSDVFADNVMREVLKIHKHNNWIMYLKNMFDNTLIFDRLSFAKIALVLLVIFIFMPTISESNTLFMFN